MNSAELEWRFQRLSKMSASEVRWRISDHVRRRRWASRQIMPDVSSQSLALRSGKPPKAPWDSARRCPVSELSIRGDAASRTGRDDAKSDRSGRRDTGGAVAAAWSSPSRHGRPRLVLRSGDRKAGASGRLLLQGQPSLRGRHREREADLGTLAHAPSHGARGSLQPLGRPALRRTRRRSSPILVGTEPLPLRRALDERDRSRAATDHLGLGAPSARQVGGSSRSSSSATRWHVPKFGGTSTTSHPSAAGDRPPTTTSSPKPPAYWWRRLPLTGSPRAPAGARRRPGFSNASWRATPSRVASIERWPSTTMASLPSWQPLQQPRQAGRAVPSHTISGHCCYRMFDVVAATVDVKLRAPRQGDGDNGTALVLDPPTTERWSGLLAIGDGPVRRSEHGGRR